MQNTDFGSKMQRADTLDKYPVQIFKDASGTIHHLKAIPGTILKINGETVEY